MFKRLRPIYMYEYDVEIPHGLQCVHDDFPKSLRPGQVMIALARILKSAILRKRLYSYR